MRGSSSNEQSQTEPINDDIYVYEGGQWQLVSFEGTTNGQYGQKEEDGFKVEEWGCTSCSTDECTVIYEGIDPAIGEIGCLEDCGDFDCVGIIHTARYFKTRAQAEEAALALIATPEFHGAAFSWGCFWQDTPWLNWDLSSIPCNDTECIPHVYLADPEGKICENNLNGELTPDDIAVNSNCPASTEYCATNGKKVWEWICD